MENYYTTREAMQLLACSRAHVICLIKKNLVKFIAKPMVKKKMHYCIEKPSMHNYIRKIYGDDYLTLCIDRIKKLNKIQKNYYYRIIDIAHILNLCIPTVTKMIRNQILPGIVICTPTSKRNVYKVPREMFDKFLIEKHGKLHYKRWKEYLQKKYES